MGDLQTFVNSAYVEEKRPGARKVNFRLYWPVLLPFLVGMVWMYFSWQQVRKANEKKELISHKFDLISKEHARLQRDYMALKSMVGNLQASTLPEDQSVPPPTEVSQSSEEQAIPAQQEKAVPERTNVSPAGQSSQVYRTGEAEQFLIIAGAGRTLEGAGIEIDRLQLVGVEHVAIYRKDSYYRIVAGPFFKDEAAPKLQVVKSKVNATAYMIPSDRWCNAPVWQDGYYECSK